MRLNLLGGLFKITIVSVILLSLRDLIRSRKKGELIVYGFFFLIAVTTGAVFNRINRHNEYLEHSFSYKIQNANVKTCAKSAATGAGPLEIDSSTDLTNINKLKFG